MRVRIAALALGLAAAGLGSACASTPAADSGVVDAQAKVVPVADTNLNRVILSADSAHRLGIVTEPVRQMPNSPNTVVPVSAVLYDKDGKTWVYTNTAPYTYIRSAVTLGPIDNDQWELTSGPAPGTDAVTVGGAELLGVEQGVAGE